MKAAIHINNASHQQSHGAAMKRGLERHGVEAVFATHNVPELCDFAVVWGWRQETVIAAAPHVLVMERGHVGDRMAETSCGWDGLARRGRYPATADGRRWERRHGHLMRPWRSEGGARALLIGQVRGDMSVAGLDLEAWQQETSDELRWLGYDVRFRPHPLMVRARDVRCPKGALASASPLAEDLAWATLAVTWSSTAGVEAALAGVPVVTLDEGAMAWPVAAHGLAEAPLTPDRTAWAWALAWCQWTLDEIESGAAWEHLSRVPGILDKEMAA